MVLEQVPDPMALCLMPDPLHLLHSRDVHRELGLALCAYARHRNHVRGTRGSVWRPQPPPDRVVGRVKERRSVRYVHLNPCRAGLVSDPLAWPWSTHRDRLGLTVSPRVRVSRDPEGFHAYVSSDPTVSVTGTPLPMFQDLVAPGGEGLDQLRAAVSAVNRVSWLQVGERTPARRSWVRAARCLSPESTLVIAEHVGLTTRAVRYVDDHWAPDVAVLGRVAGDPRFPGLEDGDLRQTSGWRRYRWRPDGPSRLR